MPVEDRPIWGIHMGRQHEMRPIQEHYVAIGWKSVGDLSKIEPSRDAFKKAVASAYPEKKKGAIPVDAGTLYRFVNEIQKGDMIVYPSKIDRMVNLGIVDGDYQFVANAIGDGPNRRNVSWKCHLPRAAFSQKALNEIGSFVTLFQIKNNAEEFVAALEGKSVDADVSAEDAEAISGNVEDAAIDFVLKQLKSKLDPYQFEHFIAHLLERMGYHSRVTAKSGDGGVDIIAHKDKLGFEPPIVKVQCKQTLATIGQPEIAQLTGNIGAGEHGLFVTLGVYSNQARVFERGRHNLRLISGEELVDLIFDHYDSFEPRYQMLLPLKKVYIPGSVSGDDTLD